MAGSSMSNKGLLLSCLLLSKIAGPSVAVRLCVVLSSRRHKKTPADLPAGPMTKKSQRTPVLTLKRKPGHARGSSSHRSRKVNILLRVRTKIDGCSYSETGAHFYCWLWQSRTEHCKRGSFVSCVKGEPPGVCFTFVFLF